MNKDEVINCDSISSIVRARYYIYKLYEKWKLYPPYKEETTKRNN